AGEDLGSAKDAGAVTVLYGSTGGLDTSNHVQYFNQDTAGVPGVSATYDSFGRQAHLDDVNGDGKADPSIGAFGEHNGNGSVVALRSDGTGLTTSGAVSVSPTSVGVDTTGAPEFGTNAAN